MTKTQMSQDDFDALLSARLEGFQKAITKAMDRRIKSLEEALLKAIGASEQAATDSADTAEKAMLQSKLERLTIKRHAVLTATLGGVAYIDIARLLGVDVTTVKLHLRAALQHLGIPSREALLVQHSKMLDGFTDKEYEKQFGIGKRWWMQEMPPELASVLLSIRPAKNQYS